MALASELNYTADLLSGLVRRVRMEPLLAAGDEGAHCIRVHLKDGAQDADLSGATCAAYIVRADSVTVPVSGVVDGSTVSITLPKAAYNVPGWMRVVVRLTRSGVTVSVLYAEGSVLPTSTDAVLDADNVIPSLDELLSKIAVMEQATAAANAATSSATAAASAAQQTAETVQQKLASGELTGRGLSILGRYASLTALQQAVQDKQAGDAYAVGTEPPYNIYIWDGRNAQWVDNGKIDGTSSLTINGKQPQNGEVTLTPGDIGAVASVNGQTGAVTLDIPAAAALVQEYTSPQNGSITGVKNGFVTLGTYTATKSGVYLIVADYEGDTAMEGRAFLAVDTSRQSLPLGETYPAATVTRVAALNEGGTVTIQLFTGAAKTYKYQYYRYTVVLLAETAGAAAEAAEETDAQI